MSELEPLFQSRPRRAGTADGPLVAPASISRIDRWANAAREDAYHGEAEVTAHALLKGQTEAHVGDEDPLQAFERAIRPLKSPFW